MLHSSTIAFASGCSLFFSRENASFKRSFSLIPSGYTSVTVGIPLVMVPVLSRAINFAFPAFSRAVAVLKSIPFFAPFPFATIIATGVASPRAHGQLITSTLIALERENPTLCPRIIQITNVIAATVVTSGTNTPETLSAILAIGAFVEEASLTVFIIFASVVSSPTAIALQV